MIEKALTEKRARTAFRPIPLALRGLVGGSLIALACTLGVGAQAQMASGEVQVTGADPFSNCTRDNVSQQEKAFGSINYPNTSIEPWVAVDPNDGSRLVMGHHQDRWNDGGARGLPGRVSTDGGSTWSDTIPPGTTECQGGTFGRGSDPWLDFSPLGTAFFLSLVLDPAQPFSPFGARNSAVLISRSADHAVSWGAPTTLINTKTPHALNDKTSMTADRTAAGFVYAVWDQLSVFPATGDKSADQLLAENDGVVIARDLVGLLTASRGGAPVFKFQFTGPTFFAMTKDDGSSWSTGRPIFQTGINAQTINNIVVVSPTGSTRGNLLDFFTSIGVAGCTSSTTLCIGYIRSTDKGATWSNSQTVASDIQLFITPRGAVVGVVTPDTGQPIRDAAILSSVAVDPNNGNLYLAWQDDRFANPGKMNQVTCSTPGAGDIPVDSIAFSQSTDGGKTWSTPVKINQTPTNANHCREQAFIPAVVAGSDGTVVVTYYDFRFDTNTPVGNEATDYFAVFCKAACNSATSWGPGDLRLTKTNGSFNILDAPVARGHFLGDYMGLAANGSKEVFPVFGRATGPNLTADFINVITLP